MQTLLVAALLLSLVASIYSQRQVPDQPTADQLQCLSDASANQVQDILDDCGRNDLTDVCQLLHTCIFVKHNAIFFPCSCQVSATVGLASPAFQAFMAVAAIMH